MNLSVNIKRMVFVVAVFESVFYDTSTACADNLCRQIDSNCKECHVCCISVNCKLLQTVNPTVVYKVYEEYQINMFLDCVL